MSDKTKIGLIGAGGIARSCHIPGYLSMPEECEIAWVADINEETLQKVADDFEIPNATTDYRELLADSSVDAISITTPNRHHHRPTIDALEAGKHVLCEKPLAMNAQEAREMCQAAERAGKILQVALQFRFAGQAQFLKSFIDKGKMGDIYYARAQALRRRAVPAWGVFIDKEAQGGGPLIDIGVHILDLTLFMMGYPQPISATGFTWDTLGKNPALFNMWGDYDREKFTVEDMAVAFIRFHGGKVVVLESSFMSNISEVEIMRTQLFGTEAGALLSAYGDDPLSIYAEHDGQLFDLTPKNIPNVPSSHTAEIQAFVNAVREGGESPVPGEQGLILNAIFVALYKSATTGHEEAIDARVEVGSGKVEGGGAG